MATGRKLVSDVRSQHKMLSTDSLITDRVILSELKNTAQLLVKRETNLRKLWATDTIFRTIPCLEMEEVSISECCDYTDPCTIARSKYKLPSISEGNYQYTIQGVYSINAQSGKATKFTPVTINRYLNLLKLPVVKASDYYWIHNDYLYITNPFLTTVRLTAAFEGDIPKEIMYPECECGTKWTMEDYCKNPLDYEFPLPGYLEKQALDMVSQKLLNTYFRLKTDLTTDNVDGQAPNTKPTN